MSFQSIFFLSLIAVAFIIILAATVKSKHFFISFLITALSGAGALAAINLLSAFTSLTLPFNFFTLTVSSVCGIPGVIALLITAIAI